MKSILLVEDDDFLTDIYSDKLKEAGFEVDVALDGDEALKKIEEYISREVKQAEGEKSWPDVILLDMVLPKANGEEILKKIKTEGGLKHTKVVILSNLGQKEEVEKGMEWGASRYLVKAHYTPSQVLAEINSLFDEK